LGINANDQSSPNNVVKAIGVVIVHQFFDGVTASFPNKAAVRLHPFRHFPFYFFIHKCIPHFHPKSELRPWGDFDQVIPLTTKN